MAKNNKYPFRLFKRGNTWHAYISCVVAGRRIVIRETTGCPDEASATDWCIKRIDAIRKSPLATHEITLDAAADKWWLERGQFQDRHGLISRLKNLILEIGPGLLLSQITKNDISLFISNCYTRGRGPATINRYLALLSAICTRAHEYWDCNTPGFKILSFRQREARENIKYFSDWQTVQTLIQHAAPHIRPIILTALYTGLRRGRILSLTWDQIDFENNIISYMGKDNKPHTVPMVNALRDVLLTLPHVNEYVFTYRGRRINEFKNAWKHAFDASGIPYKNFHTLRHTTATWLLRQTGNLRLVQSVLGHSNITTTTKYAHLLNAAASDAMNDLFSQTPTAPK